MLKGDALDFYLSNHFNTQDDTTIEQVRNLMKKHFEGPEYKISILNQWNAISFATIKRDNPDKPYIECIDLLVSKLRKLRYGLLPELQTDMHVHSKLILASEGIPDLRIACQKPSHTLQGLITDLRASATTFDRTNTSTRQELLVTEQETHYEEDDIYFTNRKYHGLVCRHTLTSASDQIFTGSIRREAT